MRDEPSTHFGLVRLLRDTFEVLNLDEATCLVGILYQSDILFFGRTWMLPALEPDEAAKLVADLFGHRESRLLIRFRNHWWKLKESTIATTMTRQIQANEFVDQVIPFDRQASI